MNEAGDTSDQEGYQATPFGLKLMITSVGGSHVLSDQAGSAIVSHRRKALSLKSSIHCGSFFFTEIARTTSSSRPFGNVSLSIMVLKPGKYGLQRQG